MAARQGAQSFVVQKDAIVVLRESLAASALQAQSIEIQKGAILIVRDDVPADEIDQIVAAARGVHPS